MEDAGRDDGDVDPKSMSSIDVDVDRGADYRFFEGLWNRRFAVAASPTDPRKPPPPPPQPKQMTKKRRRTNDVEEDGRDDARGGGVGMTTNDVDVARETTMAAMTATTSPPSRRRFFSSSEIDDLIGWATSHRCVNNHIDHDDEEGRQGSLAHIPTAPPPPSHVAFLRRRISCVYPCTTTDIVMDTSAYIAVGMAVEEALTVVVAWKRKGGRTGGGEWIRSESGLSRRRRP